jgi:hypothetical protein
MGDRPARMPGTCVVTHEQGDVEPGVGPRSLHHRPRLLALQDARRRVDPLRQQIEHAAVAVVDKDVLGTGRDGPFDRGIRLADHQIHRGRISGVAGTGGTRVVDAGDALHVDAHVDAHHPSSGPVRAW